MSDSVVEPEKRMKLFVVGEHSPNPREWKLRHVLVLAESAERAVTMAEESNLVAEVAMNESAVL